MSAIFFRVLCYWMLFTPSLFLFSQEEWEPWEGPAACEWTLDRVIEQQRAEDAAPPPFEKIYVGPLDLLTTYEGCFYINAYGEKEKVCAVLNDCHGCYIIKITRQCPICGRHCSDIKAPEGYDCPFWKTEVLPHIWSEP